MLNHVMKDTDPGKKYELLFQKFTPKGTLFVIVYGFITGAALFTYSIWAGRPNLIPIACLFFI